MRTELQLCVYDAREMSEKCGIILVEIPFWWDGTSASLAATVLQEARKHQDNKSLPVIEKVISDYFDREHSQVQ
jgi:hypothetical protein